MARAHSIYLIDDKFGRPLAAFTVKHEARRWIGPSPDLDDFYVTTIPDGGGEPRIKNQPARDFMA